jgi:hypothetical protein
MLPMFAAGRDPCSDLPATVTILQHVFHPNVPDRTVIGWFWGVAAAFQRIDCTVIFAE